MPDKNFAESLPHAATERAFRSFSSNYTRLLDLLRQQSIPEIYAELDTLTRPLPLNSAGLLVLYALDCPPEVFRAVLDHVAEPRKLPRHFCLSIVTAASFSRLRYEYHGPFYGGVVAMAAQSGRVEYLDELLRRGFDPNDTARGPGSAALTAALFAESQPCVERLLREPELDRTPTAPMLRLWNNTDFQARPQMARLLYLTGCDLQGGVPVPPPRLTIDDLPLPPQLTALRAATCWNWPLTERLCRRDSVSAKHGLKILKALASHISFCSPAWDGVRRRWWGGPLSSKALISLLDALFTACPRLVSSPTAQELLFFAALTGKRLSPTAARWLDRVPLGKFVLPSDLSLGMLCQLLKLWPSRLGLWRPAVDPARFQPHYFDLDGEQMTEAVDILLRSCQLLPFRPGEECSFLSTAILYYASMPQLLRHLSPGGLLTMEEPDVLLRAVRELSSGGGLNPLLFCDPLSPSRRNAVTAYIKRQTDYSL